MDRAAADRELEGADLVPCLEGPVLAAKDIEQQLLENDIPVLLARPEPKACCSGGCGCGSKLTVLVREADVGRVQQLMQADWLEAVRREGTLGDAPLLAQKVPTEGELACPACGHRGPLAEGACGDCGLVLE